MHLEMQCVCFRPFPNALPPLEEPLDQNPVRAAALEDRQRLSQEGLAPETAEQLAELRVFS